MRSAVVSPTARTDLDSIWLYVAANGGEDAASKFFDQINERFLALAAMPSMGRAVTEVRPAGMRKLSMGKYLIYYRLAGRKVRIVRVIHGASAQPRALRQKPL